MKRLLLALLVIVLLGVVGAYRIHRTSINGTESQLTGMKVSSSVAKQPILAVMVENSPDARPQSGLNEAGMVFETVTEGGITRYMALYQDNLPDTVGPVRSLRPYFVNWAAGFDAAVAHVGGSPDALNMIKQDSVKDLTQFKYPEPYYRSKDRSAPHNMYVHMQQLLKQAEDLSYGKSSFNGYPRKGDSPSKNPSVLTVHIDFSQPEYAAEFHYQASNNSYVRYLAGQLQTDRATGTPIMVKNVVVLKMSSKNIVANGSGNALVFLDGNVVQARWRKNGTTDPLQIVDQHGNSIKLNRGNTWFAAVPQGQTVSY